MIPSPQPYMSYSPGTNSHRPCPLPGFMHNTGIQTSCMDLHRDGTDVGCVDEWCGLQSWDMDGSSFFWTQLQREESQLWDISDCRAAVPLMNMEGMRSIKWCCVGKKRSWHMPSQEEWQSTQQPGCQDSDGMTALLYAANHNQHLIVADLIHLGASINERNNEGKSCLHLSAEKGYIQVLEVLKRVMMEGVYVDVEATDNCGMSVLQCASVALKTTVCELESSESASHTRLHMLRKEQMLETLECLLQMGSYLHTMGCWGMQPRTA
ncbi:NF-kappa-B inhibitor zeta [Sphaeramia orbicularis]|uniref:NF-kappa-B inhibitor zeta n=1 Tax=Sphaeramia orbicularis TaxID=375764 RepID=UPI00117DEFF3|nr:NF-kappa-B inhibitor zeta-like [Sphaeramia orbicularis]